MFMLSPAAFSITATTPLPFVEWVHTITVVGSLMPSVGILMMTIITCLIPSSTPASPLIIGLVVMSLWGTLTTEIVEIIASRVVAVIVERRRLSVNSTTSLLVVIHWSIPQIILITTLNDSCPPICSGSSPGYPEARRPSG